MADVAAVARQSLLDEKRLHLFDAHVFEARAAFTRGAQREVCRLDLGILRHEHSALHHVIQLADVALPGIVEQQLQRGVIEAADPLPVALRMRRQEMRRQQRNIFAAFAQRRQMNLNGVEPEQQILAKAPALHFLIQVGVGRRDHAHIHALGFGRSHALHFAYLQHAQHFGLEIQGHVGDFIQEQRAAVGQFEAAHAIGLGVGESAFDVPEQLAFKNALGQAARVDCDHRLRAARRDGVQRLGDNFLAGARLARNEHVGVRRPDARDHLQHRTHGLRLRDQGRNSVGSQQAVLGLQAQAAANGVT